LATLAGDIRGVLSRALAAVPDHRTPRASLMRAEVASLLMVRGGAAKASAALGQLVEQYGKDEVARIARARALAEKVQRPQDDPTTESIAAEDIAAVEAALRAGHSAQPPTVTLQLSTGDLPAFIAKGIEEETTDPSAPPPPPKMAKVVGPGPVGSSAPQRDTPVAQPAGPAAAGPGASPPPADPGLAARLKTQESPTKPLRPSRLGSGANMVALGAGLGGVAIGAVMVLVLTGRADPNDPAPPRDAGAAVVLPGANDAGPALPTRGADAGPAETRPDPPPDPPDPPDHRVVDAGAQAATAPPPDPNAGLCGVLKRMKSCEQPCAAAWKTRTCQEVRPLVAKSAAVKATIENCALRCGIR
jgi:hypothetical protein